jgi:Zn-dependent peptidase ImmA (M78 family)/transcriptional regulator with XRE-family HTH domain
VVISSQQLGERLADARKRAKLTQADVAEQIGVARTTLVATEKGERRPSSAELVKLASVLGVPVNDLLRESFVRAEISPRFRAGHGTEKKSDPVAEAVERLRQLARRYAELERMHGLVRPAAPLEALRTYHLPPDRSAPIDPRADGEDAARTVRGMLGLGAEPAVNLEERLETEAGLRIFQLPLPGRLEAILLWSDDVGACVAVNQGHPAEKQRWSVAHELGHFLRDREAGDILGGDDPRSRADEVFPESFTREFLMPAAGVQKRFAERCRAGKFTAVDLAALARTFEVSFQAMALRLEDLRLLPRGSYEKIIQSRIRPQELAQRQGGQPSGSRKAPRMPLRYVALAAAAYDQALLSEGELAEYLDTDIASAREIYQEHRRIPLDDGSQLAVDLNADDLRTP